MDPITGGALIAGGANLLGSAASSAFNIFQANKNNNFQERMSSTAHQREVKDLVAAGINPVLTATGGHGASTPSGSVATAPDLSRIGDTITSAKQQVSQSELNKVAILKSAAETRSINENRINQNSLTSAQSSAIAYDNVIKSAMTTPQMIEQYRKNQLQLYKNNLLTGSNSAVDVQIKNADLQKRQTMSLPYEIINNGVNGIKKWWPKTKAYMDSSNADYQKYPNKTRENPIQKFHDKIFNKGK